MVTIWKYLLEESGHFTLTMPAGAKILHCGLQGEQPTIWALVDPQAPKCVRHFIIVGTGFEFHPSRIAKDISHVGTYQQGPFVWHVFDTGEEQGKTS